MLVRAAKSRRPQPQIDLVARETEITDHEVIIRKSAVEIGLQPSIMLHPISQSIADEADMIPLMDLQPSRRLGIIG